MIKTKFINKVLQEFDRKNKKKNYFFKVYLNVRDFRKIKQRHKFLGEKQKEMKRNSKGMGKKQVKRNYGDGVEGRKKEGRGGGKRRNLKTKLVFEITLNQIQLKKILF